MGCSFSAAANRSSFSLNSSSYCFRSRPNSGNDSMKEPRPRMTSARPFEIASMVEKRWNTRIGSSDDSTVTAEPSRMRLVRLWVPASTISGAETAKSARWCSPTPIASTPTSSARTASSTRLRITCAASSGLPSGPSVMSPKVSRQSSMVSVMSHSLAWMRAAGERTAFRLTADSIPDPAPGRVNFHQFVHCCGMGAIRATPACGRRLVFFLATCLALGPFVQPALAQESGSASFRRGIGISHVMAWAPLEPAPSRNFVSPPFTYPEPAFGRELKALRRIGFDFVRFAVDPGPFLQGDGQRRDELTRQLLDNVRLILSHDLSVIVDFHPSDMHPDYLGARIAAGPDAPLFNEYVQLLARTAASLNALQSPRVGLELMNEPPPPAHRWRPMRDAAYAAVRKMAPKLLLVLDGGEEGNLEGTIALDSYRDDPTVLCFFP